VPKGLRYRAPSEAEHRCIGVVPAPLWRPFKTHSSSLSLAVPLSSDIFVEHALVWHWDFL
jgi:hypothetical protein